MNDLTFIVVPNWACWLIVGWLLMDTVHIALQVIKGWRESKEKAAIQNMYLASLAAAAKDGGKL